MQADLRKKGETLSNKQSIKGWRHGTSGRDSQYRQKRKRNDIIIEIKAKVLITRTQ
jgi:hypothetical protein